MIVSGRPDRLSERCGRNPVFAPEIFDACVIGVPDVYSGEKIKVCVFLKPGLKATVDDIIAYGTENLEKYKVPKYVEFVDDLPKNAIGKIVRKEIRRMELVKGEMGRGR